MNYEEFKDTIISRIKDFLPKKYQNADVFIENFTRMNDEPIEGLIIKLPECNATPIIPMMDFYERYKAWDNIEITLSIIAKLRVMFMEEVGLTNCPPDMLRLFQYDYIKDFENVRNLIMPRLINAKTNKEYLKDKPYVRLADLAAIYCINVEGISDIDSLTTVTDALLNAWGLSPEELHRIAIANIAASAWMTSLGEFLCSAQNSSGHQTLQPAGYDNQIFILSNKTKRYGAAVVFDKKLMDDVAARIGRNFFLVPASIHEFLAIPHSVCHDAEAVQQMVCSINRSDVLPQDKLSDNVYMYDYDRHHLFFAI